MTVSKFTDTDTLLIDTCSTCESSELKLVNESVSTNKAVLATLDGPVLDYIHPTANGRLYEESLCDKIKSSEHVAKMEATNNFLGEADHPDNRFAVRYYEVSHAIRNFRKELSKGAYYATFDILDTPRGRVLKTLLDYGTKLGVSSRGYGRSKVRKDGEVIVDPDTYKFSTFDIVVDPSNAGNRLESTNESVDTNINTKINSLLDTVNNSLDTKDIESLKSLQPVLKFLVESSTPGYDKVLSDVTNVINESESNTISNNSNEDLVEAYNTISKLESESSSKDSIIKESEDKINSLTSKITSLTKLIENYESTNSDLSSKLSDSLIKLNENSSRISQLNTELEESSSISDKYYELIDTYNESVDDYNQLLDKYKECKSSLKVLKSKYSKLNESYKVKIESMNDKLLCMNDELVEYVNELDESHDKYFSTRCSQLGLSKDSVKSKFLNESLSSYSIDEIDDILRSCYTRSQVDVTSTADLLKESSSVVGNTVSPKSSKDIMKESSGNNDDLDSIYLDGLKSSISSVRNNSV